MKYHERFHRILEENRNRGRDHQVLMTYLKFRDAELKDCNFEEGELHNYLIRHKNNFHFYDQLFEMLEKKFIL
jgi:hypothetical protein